jgi:hypothetical protein
VFADWVVKRDGAVLAEKTPAQARMKLSMFTTADADFLMAMWWATQWSSPAGEASTEEAASTPLRTAEVSAEAKAAARAHALLNASFSMRLKVFFALIRDGVNHIWRHENVTADEDSYHVLPFHLTALAFGTDISMDSLDHLASILGIDESPQSAWNFTLTCTCH